MKGIKGDRKFNLRNNLSIWDNKQQLVSMKPCTGEKLVVSEVFIKTLTDFFPGMNDWINKMDDPRNPNQITYKLRHLIWE